MLHIFSTAVFVITLNTRMFVGEVIMYAYVEWLKEQSFLYSVNCSSAQTKGDDKELEGEPKVAAAGGDEEDDDADGCEDDDIEGLPEERTPIIGYRTQKVSNIDVLSLQ